ncbi:hypothetical protein ScPMuIL_012250 [Solemya velum]
MLQVNGEKKQYQYVVGKGREAVLICCRKRERSGVYVLLVKGEKKRNGVFEDSPLLGIYCGNESSVQYSHSNTLLLTFHVDGVYNVGRFSLSYEFVAKGCGADLVGPEGTFASPGYPNPPEKEIECFWDIRVAKGSTIDLQFLVLDLPESTDCSTSKGNYVQVMDSNMKVEKTLCGNKDSDAHIDSRSNRLIIKYVFNPDSLAGQQKLESGFFADYFSHCVGELNGWRGVIESPAYSDPAPSSCSWTIRAYPDMAVVLAFSRFELPERFECHYNYLLIETKGSASGKLTEVARYCGATLPSNLEIVNTTEVVVTYESSTWNHISDQGFRLEYMLKGCGGDLRAPEGNLTLPSNSSFCYWTITVHPAHVILLIVDQNKHAGGSECDVHLELDDNIQKKYTGCAKTTSTFTSSGNTLSVKVNRSANAASFQAHYKSVKGCGGHYQTGSGQLFHLHAAYSHKEECHWSIETPTGRVLLNITQLQVEKSCDEKAMKIFDGPNSTFPLLWEIPCGQEQNNVQINSTNNKMSIYGYFGWGTGKEMNFSATYETGFGGSLFVDERGDLTSPYYGQLLPHGHDNSSASWILRTHAAEKIRLTFTDLSLTKRSDGVCQAWVEVRNGDGEDAASFGRFCGLEVPAPLYSHGSALFVSFHGTSDVGSRGFRAIYSPLSTGCGGNYTAPRGTIVYPGYPDELTTNTECEWTIVNTPGSNIHLEFSEFFFGEPSEVCSGTYVELIEDKGNGSVAKLCGDKDIGIKTFHNDVWIRLVFADSSDASSHTQVKYRGFTIQYYTVYGGTDVGMHGELMSPLYPEPAPHPSHLKWMISAATQGDLILIHFSNLRDPLDCADGVTIRERNSLIGMSAVYQYAGRDSMPCYYLSKTSSLEVAFDTDETNGGRGFHLKWSAITPKALLPDSIKLVATEEIRKFSNPLDENGQYLPSQNYTWIISTEPGYRIWLNFTFVDIENSKDCMADSITVYDGLQLEGDKKFSRQYSEEYLASFCGDNDVIMSTRSEMIVTFLTDSSINYRGFIAEYKKVCGGHHLSFEGIIESPGYPMNYPANVDCEWRVFVPEGRTMYLEFQAFNINGDQKKDCPTDFVELTEFNYYHVLESSKKLCGSVAPNRTETSSSKVKINFHSNGEDTATGFKLHYRMREVCSEDIDLKETGLNSGHISSPHFMVAECIWRITAPLHHRIQLDILQFPSEDISCHNYSLTIYDGTTQNAPVIQRLCPGKGMLSNTIKSSENELFLLFHSDGAHKRFKAEYRLAECGGQYRELEGLISYPETPVYTNYISDCEWFIEGPQFHSLEINVSVSLPTDTVSQQIGYIQNKDSKHSLTNETELTIPLKEWGRREISTLTNTNYLHFVSNSSMASLVIDYRVVNQTCGGTQEFDTGILQSPNYPQNYPHKTLCEWYIKVLPGYRISLVFLDFELEDSDCRYDYVNIYDGFLEDSPRLAQYCGKAVPPNDESSQNTMKVVFYSDGTVNRKGFSALYTSMQKEVCGGILTGSNGAVSFPDPFPDSRDSMDCTWIIQPDHSTAGTIQINVTKLLGSLQNCSEDFLEIREGKDENGAVMARLCSEVTATQMFIAVGPSVWIRLRSGNRSVSDFTLTYNAFACGGHIQKRQGEITSPESNSPLSCVWLIQVEDYARASLTFRSFSLPSETGCTTNNLEVLNGRFPTSPRLRKYCDSNSPELKKAVTTSGNSVRLIYQADGHSKPQGFLLAFLDETSSCGGIYHDSHGSLSSSGPFQTSHARCEWELHVRPGYHVLLTLNSVHLTETDHCTYYLQVNEILSNGTDVLLKKFCETVNEPASIISSGEHVYITWSGNVPKSDNFLGAWDSECGDVYFGESGVITSPGFPNSYMNNLNCNYTIAPMGEVPRNIFVEFQQFDLQGSLLPKHCEDALYVGDDENPLCGESIPNPVSGEGVLKLRFSTDRTDVRQGFRARYWTSDCGGLYRAPSGMVRSPSQFLQPHNCTWNITVEPDKAVRLKFQKLFFKVCENPCEHNYLEIDDGTQQDRICCSKDLHSPVLSLDNNVIMLRLITDGVEDSPMFQALYETVKGQKQGCGGRLKGPGNFTFTGESDLDCRWVIKTQEGSQVNLTLSKVEMKYGENLIVREKQDNGEIVVIRTIKRDSTPEPVELISKTNSLDVLYHSNENWSFGTFTASYKEVRD